MRLYAYSIYDAASKAFGTPFYLKHDGEAIRLFEDQVNKDGSILNSHPDHFTLFHIGEYDDNTAVIISTQPRSLGNGTQYVAVESVSAIDLESFKKDVLNCIRSMSGSIVDSL